jgi:hypothetical protein
MFLKIKVSERLVRLRHQPTEWLTPAEAIELIRHIRRRWCIGITAALIQIELRAVSSEARSEIRLAGPG